MTNKSNRCNYYRINLKCRNFFSEVDTIREENKKIVDSKLCKICLVKNVNVVFLPCGHICACSDCSPYIKNCAICRTYIQNVANIKVL